ncbi:MAG: hypothetical protein ACK50E_04630 [Bacteroidota bacterium]|jgi:hypothetical protein
MITRKQIGQLYGISHKTVTDYMQKAGILSAKSSGKGNRCLVTPIEFELFRKTFGEPIDRKKLQVF